MPPKPYITLRSNLYVLSHQVNTPTLPYSPSILSSAVLLYFFPSKEQVSAVNLSGFSCLVSQFIYVCVGLANAFTNYRCACVCFLVTTLNCLCGLPGQLLTLMNK